MADEIHIPESAKLEYQHVHHRHMVQLLFGAAFVLVLLCAMALYITYSYSVWPFKPLSIETPNAGNTTTENTVPLKTIEERLAELEAVTAQLSTSSDSKKIEQRRNEIYSKATVQEKTASEAAINARLEELGQ